jgi:hypothetical protein
MHSIMPTPLKWLSKRKLIDQLLQSHVEPLGQNPSQNGLAVVKICDLQRCTFIARNTEHVAGEDLLDAHGYSTKGAPHGYADDGRVLALLGGLDAYLYR